MKLSPNFISDFIRGITKGLNREILLLGHKIQNGLPCFLNFRCSLVVAEFSLSLRPEQWLMSEGFSSTQ